ncbi:DUF2630 family protein [Saccharopolyspora sp. K220]|uniref:DUF2630 family protein n=1 Tax=Saccharopolyspora soli TaxID=2926618 RepID=UPI001F56A672|nr:DUF2630 family protein [Saccharopolyspora soli]MCI2418329.1 DUF2630 family protein [Saccharopolyspora soli]
MADEDILGLIDELIDEEHRLRAAASGQGLSAEQRARLRELEVNLDQCWDLLRQRRARAEFRDSSGSPAPRPPDEVGGYLQ